MSNLAESSRIWWFALALIALLAVVAGTGAQAPSFTSVAAESVAPTSLAPASLASVPTPPARKNPELTLAQLARGRGLLAAGGANYLQTNDQTVVRR